MPGRAARVGIVVLLSMVAGCAATDAPPRATATTASPAPATQQEIVAFLAADAQEGRGIGTPGLDRSAAYIAEQFARAGLEPASSDGYFQPFEMTTNTSVAPATTLSVNGRPLRLNQDFTPLGFSAEGPLDGPVVFTGYGTVSTRPAYDDFADVDLRGKVAMFMRFGPHDEKGEARIERMQDLATRAKAAADRGAVGVLIVHPPRHRGPDELLPYVSPFGQRRISIPVVQVTTEVANHLLAAARQPDLAQLQDRIDAAFKPSSLDVADARVSGAVLLARTRAAVKNVVGVLRGRGDEYVVVGAHYDHLGRGVGGIGMRVPPAATRPSTSPTGPQIYNGADDNASGVAAVIELARRLAARGERPARSVVFAAFTAEEEGVVGSHHFVDHPPVPLDKVVAMLNLDMVGRVKDDVLFVGGAGTAPSFDALVKRADEQSPLQFKPFGKGGLGPSDHMSFALKKVPVLFLFSGLHGDYHRPSDDADKVNYAGLDQVVAVAQALVDGMLAMPREQYVDASDAGGTMGGNRPGAALGVIPDYSVTDAGGLRIAGVSPESAAARAGLKGGDVLVRLGSHKVENIYDLTDALGGSRPGDQVTVGVLRDGQPIELPAVLGEPRRHGG